MKILFKFGLNAGVFVFLLLIQTIVYAQVVIEKRPFAIDSENMMQSFDGIFDVSKGHQKIGVFIKNTGSTTIENVSGTISFDSSSGISLTSDTYSFGDLEPDIPVLGIFEASFSSASPNKFVLSLSLSGDGVFSESISRYLFVSKTEILTNTKGIVTTPECVITVEYLSFYEADNVLSLTAPTHMLITMEPAISYAGQYATLPFSSSQSRLYTNPYAVAFKTLSGVFAMALWGAVAVDGYYDSCGEGFLDDGMEQMLAYGGAVCGVVAGLDLLDPFRRGENNTIPLDGELTTKEEIDLYIAYDSSPVPQDVFTGTTTMQYTRYTTGNEYNYSVSYNFANDIHSSTDRQISTYHEGNKLIVTGSFKDPSETVIIGSGAYVVAMLSHLESPTEKIFLSSYVMTDDGKNADTTALDGVFTCSIPNISGSDYIIDVMATDINSALETDAALVASTKIGGALISHSLPNPSIIGIVAQSGELQVLDADNCYPTGDPCPTNTPISNIYSIIITIMIFSLIAIYFIRIKGGNRNDYTS